MGGKSAASLLGVVRLVVLFSRRPCENHTSSARFESAGKPSSRTSEDCNNSRFASWVDRAVTVVWSVMVEALVTVTTSADVEAVVLCTVFVLVVVGSETSVVAVVVCVEAEAVVVTVAEFVADLVTVDGSGSSLGLIVCDFVTAEVLMAVLVSLAVVVKAVGDGVITVCMRSMLVSMVEAVTTTVVVVVDIADAVLVAIDTGFVDAVTVSVMRSSSIGGEDRGCGSSCFACG
jgi:hypothetical protein